MHHHQHISKACGFFVFQKEAGKSRGGSGIAAVVSSSSYLESFMAFLENQFTCKNIFEMIVYIIAANAILFLQLGITWHFLTLFGC